MHLIAAYAKMFEASVLTPERFPCNKPSAEVADRRLRIVRLLRALTEEEAQALLRNRNFPARLPALAEEVGLSVEVCNSALAMVLFNLTEGLKPIRDTDRK